MVKARCNNLVAAHEYGANWHLTGRARGFGSSQRLRHETAVALRNGSGTGVPGKRRPHERRVHERPARPTSNAGGFGSGPVDSEAPA